MWVTQTYLTSPEPDARVHVFYLFEDYVDEQKRFTNRVQAELARLGDAWGKDVALAMPNPHNAEHVEREIRETLGKAYWDLKPKLPALMIVDTSLNELAEDAEMEIIPFAGRRAAEIAEVIDAVRTVVNDRLERSTGANSVRLLRRVLDALELKPGISGFSIDLKKLRRRRRRD